MSQYQKEYADFLNKFLDLRKEIKVVFDCSNGSAEIILRHLPASPKLQRGENTKKLKAILINQNADGDFPAHGPDPLKSGAMNGLKKAVLKNKADLGVIFDADGDRAFFVDDRGRFVNSDQIARLLIWNLDLKKIVSDVRASWLVKKMGIVESRVGHYFIKKIMRQKNIPFGYENSGHYYFDFPNFGKGVIYDSGILAAIKVINAVSQLPYKLSDFADLLPAYFRSGEINIKLTNNQKLITKNIFKKLENEYRVKAVKISHIDGLRMEFYKIGLLSRSLDEGWWFNIRFSNTEPIVRINIEATNKEILAKQTKMLLGWLHNNIIV